MDEIKEQSTNPKEKLQYFYLCAWMGVLVILLFLCGFTIVQLQKKFFLFKGWICSYD